MYWTLVIVAAVTPQTPLTDKIYLLTYLLTYLLKLKLLSHLFVQ